MAKKNIGQSNPSASTWTVVKEGASGKEYVVSSISIANQGSTTGTFRLAHVVGGTGSPSTAEIFWPSTALVPSQCQVITIGITFEDGDSIQAYCSTGDFSVNIWGDESDQ